jgi:hypothetical protein
MATQLRDVKKINDAFHRRSSSDLKRETRNQINKVFVSALELIEIKFGRDFDGYAELRAKILRVGNDAIRHLDELIDNNYNVQKVPNLLVINKEGGE